MNLVVPTRRNRAQRGFTLFELIVAISILVLLFGMAIAGYNKFNRRERLKQAGLTIKSNIRFAQTKALSVDKPTSGCTTFTGMRVRFTARTYVVDHMCTEGVVGTSDTFTLPPGISLSPIPATFTFAPLKGTISLAAGQSIILTNTADTYTMTITGTGDISDIGLE